MLGQLAHPCNGTATALATSPMAAIEYFILENACSVISKFLILELLKWTSRRIQEVAETE
jgi:hypothetical protein